MDTESANQKKPKMKLIVIIACVLCLGCGALAFALLGGGKGLEKESESEPKLKYASGGVTAITGDELQRAVEEMYEKSQADEIALYYKNEAYSDDGKEFSCYIGNSPENTCDTFFAIYADDTYEDMIFLSDLLRPGEAFETIALEHPLEKGEHKVYCAQTLVEDDLETIHNQLVFTLVFKVGK